MKYRNFELQSLFLFILAFSPLAGYVSNHTTIPPLHLTNLIKAKKLNDLKVEL